MSPERTRRLIEEVEQWRKANNIKQKDLAETLGISPQQYNNIVKARTDPTAEQALHMQQLMGRKPGSSRKP